jgi:hypothetical protein
VDLSTWQLNHPPGDPVTHLNPYLTGCRPPGIHHRCASFGLYGAVSLVPPLGIRRRGGGGDVEDGGPLHRAAGWKVEQRWVSCLDPVETRPHGGSRSGKEEKTTWRNTEHQFDHRRKHGGRNRHARVRVQPLISTKKKKKEKQKQIQGVTRGMTSQGNAKTSSRRESPAHRQR